MTTIPSATTWGSPASTKHALLIHGLTSSSHTWQGIAKALAAQGYYVTAPNLVGHACRAVTDCTVSATAKDLQPYLEARNYSLIIGHSLGGAVALGLFPLLPKSHPTAIVLVDPALKLQPEQMDALDSKLTKACVDIQSAEAIAAEYPRWTRKDCIARELAARTCSVDVVHGVLTQNRPWDFISDLGSVPEQWKVTVLPVAEDPAVPSICPVENLTSYPHVRVVTIPGVGHWIHHEALETVVEEALKTVKRLEAA